MMDCLSLQGISNSVAENYIQAHGNATWSEIEKLMKHQACPRLRSYWTYEDCCYEKVKACCAEPRHFARCSVPSHKLRNGRLNQMAYSLFLFVRDVARRNLLDWIDAQFATVSPDDPNRPQLLQESLLSSMRSIYGVSDKTLSMTLSEILMSAPLTRPQWFEVGSQMIVINSLVHHLLHRTSILKRFGADHAYGAGCYQHDGCADILRQVSSQIDARRFNPAYPSNFPRFVQHSLWNHSSIAGQNVCNGIVIDDTRSCERIYCPVYTKCGKIALNR